MFVVVAATILLALIVHVLAPEIVGQLAGVGLVALAIIVGSVALVMTIAGATSTDVFLIACATLLTTGLWWSKKTRPDWWRTLAVLEPWGLVGAVWLLAGVLVIVAIPAFLEVGAVHAICCLLGAALFVMLGEGLRRERIESSTVRRVFQFPDPTRGS